ncbi:MAG: DUF362 domain-containing protein [Candidatus Zambryskibacteria bacterium]|nr:DUF362 domain-containing protein [Candidatus Zambryskibacteria bacterium]
MTEKHFNPQVSCVQTGEMYPDFPYASGGELEKNLRDLLEGLGLSRENPFSSYVKPGQTVLIKPNWVRDRNPLGYDISSLITHTSLIKYVIDFLLVAMEGKGKIVIADAPLQNCNFSNLRKEIRIDELVESVLKKYPDMDIVIEDWRLTTIRSSDTHEPKVQNFKESSEYRLVDLGKESLLEDVSKYSDRFRVTKYKRSLMAPHHQKGIHEYLVSRRIHEADFFINMPKMKTHIKAGLTCSMKNLVGINGHKEFLPHHIKGSYFEGGDNYSRSSWLRARYEDLYDYVWENINNFSVLKRKILMRALQYLWALANIVDKENISAGSWRGNDTIWRTTLDLNHIAYFDGAKPLKILTIVDGIIAGEGQGPLEPTPKPLGILLAGENPAYIDAVVAQMMGFTVARIPTVYNAIYNRKSKFSDVFLEDFKLDFKDQEGTKKVVFSEIPDFNFKKPLFWEGA